MSGNVPPKFVGVIMVLVSLFVPLESRALDLRLMTYDINNATGLDGRIDPGRIAAVIEKLSPDVVAIQNVDSITGRSQGRNLLAEIAGYAGMRNVFAPAIKTNGGKSGIGILCKETPKREMRVALPGHDESRVLLAVEFNDYIFACTQLSPSEPERLSSLAIIDSVANLFQKPFFIAGDFNARVNDAFMEKFTSEFDILSTTNELSFPSDKPAELIDYIAVRKGDCGKVIVKQSHVADEPIASDHRPVYVDIMLKQSRDKIISVSPYLQNPTDGGITIMWQTSVPSTGVVEFGSSSDDMTRVRTLLDGQADWGKMHKVRINGLEPGKKYYYRVISREILEFGPYHKVFGDSAMSEMKSFTIPDLTSEDFTAVIFNDLHQHTSTFRALCDRIREVDYDFVVFNGDVIDDPANHSQATRFLKELNEGVGADSIPVFYIRGNHEIRGAYSIGLRDLFDYVGGLPYSAFSWGDTRFVVLDCGEDKPDNTSVYYGLNDFTGLRQQQAKFLNEELKSKEFKKAKKRVLIHHAPVYGLEVDYTDYNPCLEIWGPILEKAPFDVALNAHTHKFAFHPRGTKGNNYPVIVGGGFSMADATVMILSRKGRDLKIKVLNTSGDILLETEL
ncbi:MAG: metallophosphoesterase [Paramuribaculum sp.]|nr:metallophosphoesterase [Paramuribaculum sp.]